MTSCLACDTAHEREPLPDLVAASESAGPWVSVPTSWCAPQRTVIVTLDGMAILWPDDEAPAIRVVRGGRTHAPKQWTMWRPEEFVTHRLHLRIDGPPCIHLRVSELWTHGAFPRLYPGSRTRP